MSPTQEELKTLVYDTAPALDPAWLAAEATLKSTAPAANPSLTTLERQPLYAQACRDLFAAATAPGAPHSDLLNGIRRTEFTVPSATDDHKIPILQLDNFSEEGDTPQAIVIYYHGGGLKVGEADSEELSCRKIVKDAPVKTRLYSVGYRLMPKYPASICESDALDAFTALASGNAKPIVVGSSSGGQLAATVAQRMGKGRIHGLLLRCPVTCDPSGNQEFIPTWLRPFHTSMDPSFITYLLQTLQRETPRDGLRSLPLEADIDELQEYPRTWLQLCTNDTLYSDGLCLAMALVKANIEVRLDVLEGWPHTFWLKTPLLKESVDAEQSMIKGLHWLLG